VAGALANAVWSLGEAKSPGDNGCDTSLFELFIN
jgi:hypothetical protein